MNELMILNYTGNIVRTVLIDGEVLFVAKDVCDILNLTTITLALERVSKDDLRETQVTDSSGRQQLTKIVNEKGLYKLLFESRKPEAEKIKQWLASEVMPSIRKTGGYVAPGARPQIHTPEFVKRFHDNSNRTHPGYFSVISELYIRFHGKLELMGYIMPDRDEDGNTELRPDISVGRHFAKYLREKYHDEEIGYRMYWNYFRNAPQREVAEYALRYLGDFAEFVENIWIPEHAEKYFKKRAPAALPAIKNAFAHSFPDKQLEDKNEHKNEKENLPIMAG
jgi:prophage antirepressor-like protein